MSIADQIRENIEKNLSPDQLEIVNQSHLHGGHAGDDGSGESHFKLKVVMPGFSEYSRIERQRLVFDAMGEDLVQKIHAIQMVCLVS